MFDGALGKVRENIVRRPLDWEAAAIVTVNGRYPEGYSTVLLYSMRWRIFIVISLKRQHGAQQWYPNVQKVTIIDSQIVHALTPESSLRLAKGVGELSTEEQSRTNTVPRQPLTRASRNVFPSIAECPIIHRRRRNAKILCCFSSTTSPSICSTL